jgi:hypothetical protein
MTIALECFSLRRQQTDSGSWLKHPKLLILPARHVVTASFFVRLSGLLCGSVLAVSISRYVAGHLISGAWLSHVLLVYTSMYSLVPALRSSSTTFMRQFLRALWSALPERPPGVLTQAPALINSTSLRSCPFPEAFGSTLP